MGKPLSRFPRPLEPGFLQHLLVQACDVLNAAHRACRPVDGAADDYALGAVAYRMTMGLPPSVRGQRAEHVLSRIPKDFSEVLLRAISWRPEERFARALDFKQTLLGERTSMRAPRPSAQEPALPATWRLPMHRLGGANEVELQGRVLSRSGIFLCYEKPLPDLVALLTFSPCLDGHEVECVGEVVLHVDSAQARAWGMGPGVGLQFVNPSPRLRELLRHPRPSPS